MAVRQCGGAKIIDFEARLLGLISISTIYHLYDLDLYDLERLCNLSGPQILHL